jgi:hypothetical protein
MLSAFDQFPQLPTVRRIIDGAVVRDGALPPPQVPGIGFETRSSLDSVFRPFL